MTRKLISFDWAIKKVLRSKANFGILEGFLSELLFTEITILEVLESESNQKTGDDKYNRVDIKVRDCDQQIIIIEIQYSRELDYLQRILFATSKVITEHLEEGASYSDVSKVISVNILYFNFGKEEDYIYYGTTNFIGMHNQSVLELSEKQKRLYTAKTIAKLYPEYYLIEIRNFDDIAKNTLDEWIYFLKNEKIEDDFTAKGLEQAKETLNVLKMNKEDRLAYENHQTQLHHEASLYESTYVLGIEEGIEKGIEKGILLTAKKMKQAGMPMQTISDMTDLSIEQIENIAG
ncbi:MAG: Rpn family recombination-promoting nuclease/putative transposase [Gammaproteobacteria bacterium]|nr:Rpn family recombination-promoting nuclease/putative transposase [Gammaproteobacteria bacterium]